MLDMTTEAGRTAAHRFETELIIWLTTVSPAGQPQSSPVWFLWEDGEFLVYSLAVDAAGPEHPGEPARGPQPEQRRHGRATSSPIEGEARIDPDAPLPSGVPAMIAKYRHLIEQYGWTVERYAADYPTAIRIRPTRFRFG